MRDLRWILATLILVACAEPHRHARSVNGDLSSTNHKCGFDAVRPGEVTKDGLPVRYWLPCWDWSKDPARYRTHTDPAASALLAKVEATQCVGLIPAALERSPFVQDQAIGEIVPHRNGSTIHGAHVVFKSVPGLTMSWMRRAIACHRARWQALGYPADYLAGDPTLVEGTEVHINGDNEHIIVLIESDSTETGEAVLSRARKLVAEPLPVAVATPTTWRKD